MAKLSKKKAIALIDDVQNYNLYASRNGLSCKSLEGYDFSGLDLTYLDLSYVSFSKCNLSNVDFTGTKLVSVNFSGSKLTNTKFINADLSCSWFIGTNLCEAVIKGTVNFTSTKLPSGVEYIPALDGGWVMYFPTNNRVVIPSLGVDDLLDNAYKRVLNPNNQFYKNILGNLKALKDSGRWLRSI